MLNPTTVPTHRPIQWLVLRPILLLLGAAMAPAAPAAEPPAATAATPSRRGDHPAVVVQRLARSAGYDYAARFYPHPAWMWLLPAPEPDTAFAAGVRPPPEGPVLRTAMPAGPH